MESSMQPADGRALREALWRRALERRAPRMTAGRVVAALMPRPGAVVVAVVAVCAMLPGLGLAAFMLHLAADVDVATRAGGALGLFGVVGTTPAAVLLVVAAAFAGRPGARAMLLAAAVVLLVVGGSSCGTALTLGEKPIEGGAPAAARAAAAIFGPFVLLLALPTAALAIWTPIRLQRDLVAERRRRLLEVLMERGSVAMDDLMLAANLDEPGVRRHLEELGRSGQLAVRVDDGLRWVATTRRIAGRQALLVDLVETRGRIGLDTLAEELGEPVAVVRGWIDELVRAGALAARVDDDGLCFDPDRAGSPLTRSCASCGGPMRAVGRGLHHCVYCDAEAYG